jgi:hypothetical protein
MLISRMEHRACHFLFYLQSQPIISLREDFCLQPIDCPTCKSTNHWSSSDAHHKDILTFTIYSSRVCTTASSHDWQQIYCFQVKFFASKSIKAFQFLILHYSQYLSHEWHRPITLQHNWLGIYDLNISSPDCILHNLTSWPILIQLFLLAFNDLPYTIVKLWTIGTWFKWIGMLLDAWMNAA